MNSANIAAHFTDEHGEILIRLARLTIAAKLAIPDADGALRNLIATHLSAPVFQEKRGTFVTLKIKEQLRGCMGCLTPSETVLEGIQRNAINAAFNDPRFPALTGHELEQAAIEISILTSPQDLQYADASDLLNKIRPDIDGVTISKGRARATFLPQVWKQLPKPDDFLTHLCRKAGLHSDEWKLGELDVSVYQVQYFNENG
ncbi:MAG: AmmeMemoRadiSam system protein A [Desulfobulbales bacterium]|nr:AmmeMemoRadiSam system protein A [Desulfobulbales bacterium]